MNFKPKRHAPISLCVRCNKYDAEPERIYCTQCSLLLAMDAALQIDRERARGCCDEADGRVEESIVAHELAMDSQETVKHEEQGEDWSK